MGRVEKTRLALLSIGPSMVGASATSIFSMAVLMFCSTHLFAEIGIIVASTLVLGMFFALGSFAAGLTLVGPQGDACTSWRRPVHVDETELEMRMTFPLVPDS